MLKLAIASYMVHVSDTTWACINKVPKVFVCNFSQFDKWLLTPFKQCNSNDEVCLSPYVKHYKTQRKCIKGRADLPNFLPATAKGSDDVTSFKGWTLEHSFTSVEVFS